MRDSTKPEPSILSGLGRPSGFYPEPDWLGIDRPHLLVRYPTPPRLTPGEQTTMAGGARTAGRFVESNVQGDAA